MYVHARQFGYLWTILLLRLQSLQNQVQLLPKQTSFLHGIFYSTYTYVYPQREKLFLRKWHVSTYLILSYLRPIS